VTKIPKFRNVTKEDSTLSVRRERSPDGGQDLEILNSLESNHDHKILLYCYP
jgi:hypothetical protein